MRRGREREEDRRWGKLPLGKYPSFSYQLFQVRCVDCRMFIRIHKRKNTQENFITFSFSEKLATFI
jgi:hypothetical protein